jgi:hypothetical protein
MFQSELSQTVAHYLIKKSGRNFDEFISTIYFKKVKLIPCKKVQLFLFIYKNQIVQLYINNNYCLILSNDVAK